MTTTPTLQPEITLPSGATLRIQVAQFAVSKALYQAMLRELRDVRITMRENVEDMLKNLFCAGFSSPAMEDALWACFQRCLYNGKKIDKDTFEPEDARGDYVQVCVEVGKANVFPFMKSLYADFAKYVQMAESSQK